MLSFIKDLPGHVLRVQATGTVDKTNFENILLPAWQEKNKIAMVTGEQKGVERLRDIFSFAIKGEYNGFKT